MNSALVAPENSDLEAEFKCGVSKSNTVITALQFCAIIILFRERDHSQLTTRRANSASLPVREMASASYRPRIRLAASAIRQSRAQKRSWRLCVAVLLPHFLDPLPGHLVEGVILHWLDQELSQRPHQRIDAVWGVACPGPIEIRREGAHLVLQLGEGADVVDPALCIQRGDRFGAGDFDNNLPVTTVWASHWIVASTMAPPLLRSATMRSA